MSSHKTLSQILLNEVGYQWNIPVQNNNNTTMLTDFVQKSLWLNLNRYLPVGYKVLEKKMAKQL